jgi:hypothetical protein
LIISIGSLRLLTYLENCAKKHHGKLLRIAAPYSCSRELFAKLLPKVVLEIFFPKLVPEGGS